MAASPASAASLLHRALGFLSEAVQASEAAKSAVVAQEAEATAAREAEVQEFRTAAQAGEAARVQREAALEAELASEREARVRLANELALALEERSRVGAELAAMRANALGGAVGMEVRSVVAASEVERLTADNLRHVARAGKMAEVIEKQRNRLREHEVQLRRCKKGARSDGVEEPVPAKRASVAAAPSERHGSVGLRPCAKRRRFSVGSIPVFAADVVEDDAKESVEQLPLQCSRTAPHLGVQPPLPFCTAPLPPASAGSCSVALSASGSGAAATVDGRDVLPQHLRDVPGVRVYNIQRQTAPPVAIAAEDPLVALATGVTLQEQKPQTKLITTMPEGGLATSATGAGDASAALVARAEGRVAAAAAAAPRGGVPCRCVKRKKEERLALQGFDCEMCRAFYDATGLKAPAVGAGPGCLAASRHRFEYAPTSTPAGFWDLSFPRGDGNGSED